jgi:hypothetical protein
MSGSLAPAHGWFTGGSTSLTRCRVCAYAALLLGLEIAGLAFCIAGTHGWIVPLRHPVSTDFVSFYAAGQLVDAGTPALVYDHSAHYAAEQAATAPGVPYNFFYYPPVYLLLCAILARLPYLVSFLSFQTATLLPCLAVARRIVRLDGWAGVLPLLAFPPVFYTLGTGQNAFLTAALFGGATLLVDRRPVVAGLLFGALCYKPHFGLLIPVALAAAGRWRAFAAAAAALAAAVALSILAYGVDPWRAYLAALSGADAIYRTQVSQDGMASPFGIALVLGLPSALAYAIQATATLAMIATVFVVWRRGFSLPVRAAILVAATPIAVPVVMFYDLMLSGIALAWLVRWGYERGALARLAIPATTLYCAALLSGNFHPTSRLLITPIIAIGTLVLAMRAAALEGRAATR